MIRDAIHRNDKYFTSYEDLLYLVSNVTTMQIIINRATVNTTPFNNRYLSTKTNVNSDSITFYYKHSNHTNKAVLYLFCNPNNTSCTFDVYVDGILKTTVNNNGTGKNYQGFEPLYITLDVTGDNIEHEIKFTNFTQNATTPDLNGYCQVYLQAIGSKLTNVYLTGKGSQTTQFFIDNINDRILQYNPDLFIFIIGANDRASLSPEQFDTNLRSILTQVRTLRPNCQIMLLSPTDSQNDSDETLNNGTYIPNSITNEYIEKMREIAIDFNCYFLDLVKLFANIPRNEWRYDNVHMTKYGNTILARTVLNLIMPNGLYDKSMVDSNISYNSGKISKLPEQIHGWAYIAWNGSAWVVSAASNDGSILAATKKDIYKISLQLKYTIGTFLYGFNANQFGSVGNILSTRIYSYGSDFADIVIMKNGVLVSNSDYNTTDMKFIITY
jgi:lysophospholipase L1-like esterase